MDVFHRKMGEIGEFLPAPAQPLKTPATFVGGSRSQYLAPQHHATVRKYFGDAQIHMLEGAGAWPCVAMPSGGSRVLRGVNVHVTGTGCSRAHRHIHLRVQGTGCTLSNPNPSRSWLWHT